MTYLKFSEGLERICCNAFYGSGLELVKFPASLRTIAPGAFALTLRLKTVELNEGLEVLGTEEYQDNGEMYNGVFDVSTVESVRLPSTLKRIGYYAFRDCKMLKSVNLPEKLEHIGKACFKESALEAIAIPSAVKVLEEFTFYKCGHLTDVHFQEGLERIEANCFYGTKVCEMTLPQTVRHVGECALSSPTLKWVNIGDNLALNLRGAVTGNTVVMSFNSLVILEGTTMIAQA